MVDKQIKAILNSIEGSISDFQKGIPGIQKGMLDKLLTELKDLQVRDGKVLNSVQNLKKIGEIKNKLERLVISQGYKDSVKQFVEAFDVVSGLHQQYFSQFNAKFKPSKTLPIIKQLAVDSTVNGLLGQGLAANVVDRVGSILQTNITTGGSYASLNDQLRASIVGGEENEGMLQRYSKTITTDAINQYSAQYHETIATDLQFNWGRYVGSNITTTREFCDLLTEKEWVHRSELPAIVEGKIDGKQCKLSKSTGLPLGMIPGTDENNFKVRRGGYNCGHQFFWVPDSAVPAAVKIKFEQKGKVVTSSDKIKQNNERSLNTLEKRGVVFPEEVLNLMHEDVKIRDAVDGGSYFSPDKNEVVIGGQTRADNEYYQKKIVYHEGGHAIHFNKKIITYDHVDPEFQTFYKGLKTTLGTDAQEIDGLLWDKGMENYQDDTITQQVGMLHDTLGSLTKGLYGSGHTVKYYNTGNYSLMEVFAHSMTLARLKNDYVDIHPTLRKIADMMKEYGLKILESE